MFEYPKLTNDNLVIPYFGNPDNYCLQNEYQNTLLRFKNVPNERLSEYSNIWAQPGYGLLV